MSDRNKILILNSQVDVWEFLTLGMFADPEDHPMGTNAAPPHAPTPVEMQVVYQQNFTETVYQLVLFPAGREEIQKRESVMKALERVAACGLTAETRRHAEGALLALSDKELHASGDGPKHIMMSYQVSQSLVPEPVLRQLDLLVCATATVGQPACNSQDPRLALPPWICRLDRHRDDEGFDYGRDE